MLRYVCENCGLQTNTSECPHCLQRTKLKSELYWCKHCNVPIYEEVCSICGEKGMRFTSDARPVFPEERLLIELMLGTPLKYINESVWNGSGNRYYVNGKRLQIELGNYLQYNVSELAKQYNQYSGENSYDSFNVMIDKFISANKARYHAIVTESCDWIVRESQQFDSSSMFVSFSGGKDSTVVSSLVTKALGRKDIIHIFGNTTLEFPMTYEYVARFKDENRKTPVLLAQNKEQDFFKLCETFGPPSRMLRWCCTVFKTGFIGEKIQRTFKNKRSVLTFYGIRRAESASRNKYDRKDDSPKISKQKVTSPIIDWMDFDVWLYILTAKIDFNDAYRLGFARVGCWCCPNNSSSSEFLTRIFMPELYAKFRNMIVEFAKKMGKESPEEYAQTGGWKARQGGAGLEYSKMVAVSFKPCATDADSFNYVLTKPIDDSFYELFKPFGKLNFAMGNERLGEVFVVDSRDIPILKLKGRKGSRELRVTVLNKPIANRTKIVEIEQKIKCQIAKYQICVGCHACENACKFNAIKLTKNGTSDSDYLYSIDENKCVHCYECIDHYPGGCYMRRVFMPRGKNYGK